MNVSDLTSSSALTSMFSSRHLGLTAFLRVIMLADENTNLVHPTRQPQHREPIHLKTLGEHSMPSCSTISG